MTPALRVALVGPLPPPAGGMANQCRQLTELLRGEGVEVEVVQVNAPYRPAWLGRVRGVRALARLLPFLLALWRVCRRVDVMHVMANSGWSWHLFAAPAVWIGWLRGVPVIINYRGGGAEAFFESSLRTVAPTLKRTALVVVPSGFLQVVFGKFGFAAQCVPNIIDLRRFIHHTLSSAANPAPHIIVTRNLEPIYAIDTAIRAFARVVAVLPGARLTVAGEGPELANLQALAAALGVAGQVSFVGRIDNREIPALYASADLMLNPSTVDNMPISILEALASGVPVVSTDVGGVAHLVTAGKTALLVPPQAPEQMAEAMLNILQDQALALTLSNNGLADVQQYAWPSVREQWFKVYRDAIGNLGALSR